MVEISVKASSLPFLHFGPVLLMATRNPVANSPVEVGSWNIPNHLLRFFLKHPRWWSFGISAINYISSIFEASTSHPGPGGDSSTRWGTWRMGSHDLDTWLGSPPFISHFHVHFGRGLTTRSLGHGTINHGYPWTRHGIPSSRCATTSAVSTPPSDPQTYRSSEWMQGPQLR